MKIESVNESKSYILTIWDGESKTIYSVDTLEKGVERNWHRLWHDTWEPECGCVDSEVEEALNKWIEDNT